MTLQLPKDTPERIKIRLRDLSSEVTQICSAANHFIKTDVSGRISFTFKGTAQGAEGHILSDSLRAQAVSFVTRFDNLPETYAGSIVRRDGQYHIGNMDLFRHALNEFRPLIENKQDSVHYKRIHGDWSKMLGQKNPTKATSVQVFQLKQGEITSQYLRYLGEHQKAIDFVLARAKYKYLYNGILQHSDAKHSSMFLRDYTSGELNYIFWKHVHMLGFIRECLRPYVFMIKSLISPRLGAL